MATLLDRVRGFVGAGVSLGADRVIDGREAIQLDTNCVPTSGFFWLVRLGTLIPQGHAQTVVYRDHRGATEYTSQLFLGQAILTACRHDDPMMACAMLSAWVYTDAGVYKAEQSGFTVTSIVSARDVTSEVSSYFERGAQMEFSFTFRAYPGFQELDTITEVEFEVGPVDDPIVGDLLRGSVNAQVDDNGNLELNV